MVGVQQQAQQQRQQRQHTSMEAAASYLEDLWREDHDEEQLPILAASEVISKSQHRPTYQELASGTGIVSLHPGGTGGSHRRPGPGAGDSGSSGGLERHLAAVLRNVDARQATYDGVLLQARKAADLVRTMETEISSLQDEVEQLQQHQPPAPERLRKVQQWLLERQAALRVQEMLKADKQLALIKAESELRAAETELEFLAEQREDLAAGTQALVDTRGTVADELREREERAARGYALRQDREAERIAALEEEAEQMREARVRAAEEGMEKATERLAEKTKTIKAVAVKGSAAVAASNQQRRSAVLELKSSLAGVEETVAHKARLYRQLQQQKHEVQEKEFQQLLEAGLNPYEVYRRRDVEAEVAHTRAQIASRITARQAEVAAQLAHEEELYNAARQQRERQRRERIAFDKEMSVAGQDLKTEAYLKSHTTGGITMLDPTGRLPVDPSSVMVVKTPGFGLGHSNAALLDKMSTKHPDVTAKALLMPAQLRDMANASSLSVLTPRSLSRALTGRSRATSRSHITESDDDSPGPDSPPHSPRVGNESWKVLQTRPLTKLEQAIMDKARARHKSSVSRPKVMMGREFSGDSFMPSPAVVLFKDFEVGRTYRCKVALINKSYCKNTYRVIDIPVEYGNVLEVSYDLPGYVATGVAGEITILFTPKENQDIETQVNMLSETGPFHVPIRCLTKKAVLSASATELDFGSGGVTLGESATRVVTIVNDGALDVDFTAKLPNDGQEAGGTDMTLISGAFSIMPSTGHVAGYGKATITVTFAPTTAVASQLPLQLAFRAPSQRKLAVPTLSVALRGVGRDVPIYLDRSTLDFKCCIFDHSFRDQLVVRNAGKTAMKISVVKRPELDPFFEFIPDFGFVQAGEPFPITVRFKPNAELLERCSKHVVDASQAVLEVPMRLNVPDQKLPVTFTIRAQVTASDLTFDPPSLDFGPCVMNERTAVTLRITNHGLLPQTFGFLNVNPGVDVTPNDGFGFILPGETMERLVTCQPPIAGPQSFTLTCKTLARRTFLIPCKAVGVQPPLSLSHNKIQFPATPVGDTTSVSLVLRNHTERPQAFEFAMPAGSGLMFHPHLGEVPPQRTLRVQVDFTPPKQAQEASRATPGSTANALEGIEEGDEEEDEEGEEDWYRWAEHRITCYIRPLGYGAGDPHSPGVESDGIASQQQVVQQLHLNIATCVVEPDIILRTPLGESAGPKKVYELDFGPVPVGQRVVRNLEIFNQGPTSVPLHATALDTREFFAVVNTMRKVRPSGAFHVLLSFTPQQRTLYREALTISSPKTRIQVVMKGQGIAPELRLGPEGVVKDGLHFGSVLRGEAAERTLTVTNVCPFPLTFTMELARGLLDPNLAMRPPFFCRPGGGTLAQGETCEVTVVFQPSNQRPYYEERLRLVVPNQQEELLVPLQGNGWEEGVFLVGPEYPPPPEDPFMEDTLTALASSVGASEALAPASKGSKGSSSKPPVAPTPGTSTAAGVRQLTYTFPKPVYLGEVAMATIEAGNLKSTSLSGASGEVVIDELPPSAKEAGWSIDPLRMPLAPGDQKPITIKYTAPKEAHAGMAAYFGHEEHVTLEAFAVLKGGVPAPPTADGRRVKLLFKVLVVPTAKPAGLDEAESHNGGTPAKTPPLGAKAGAPKKV